MGIRWWHPVVSVLVAASLGAVTNLVTGTFSWTLAAVAVGLVLAQIALSLWQGRQDLHARRAARDELLGVLRPDVPEDQGEEPRVAFWLTAPYSPTPLWGRDRERDRLLAWCVDRDPKAGAIRVLAGPAGVGKSRLALAVAEALPSGWSAGWVDSPDGVVERIVAAGDPTLLLVDDADRLDGLATLITRATRHPDLIRVLLLTRGPDSLRALPDTLQPHVSRAETLTPIGAGGDRTRWFADAVRAYAAIFRVPPPEVSALPVGRDEDTPLVLHARALLTVNGRPGDLRTSSLGDIARDLVRLEQRHWTTSAPAGCDPDILAEALTILVLIPAEDLVAAAESLRRVPQLSHDASHETRMAVARWAYRLYPPAPDHRLNLRPDLIAERLVIDTLTRTPQLLTNLPPTALATLTRAAATFPDALDLLTATLTQFSDQLPTAIPEVLNIGIASPGLDRALALLIHPDSPDRFFALITLSVPDTFPQLQCALAIINVAYQRTQIHDDPDEYRCNLAVSLNELGASLWKAGRPQESLAAVAEAVEIWRTLAESEPGRYRLNLARSVSLWGAGLQELRRLREALAVSEEAVEIWRTLAETGPDSHRADLARALDNWGADLLHLGRPREALAAFEEAVTIVRKLTGPESDRYRPDLAKLLLDMGGAWRELGRPRDTLAAVEQAVTISRELADTEPERYGPDLAVSLINLGVSLRGVRRPDEALAADEEALALWRELAATRPGLYRPHLARSLSNLGVGLTGLSRPVEALAAFEQASALWRTLADAEPDSYRPSLARALSNVGASLLREGRPLDAVAAFEEAVTILRDLAGTEPARYRPDLADSLASLGPCLAEIGRLRDALAAQVEAVAIRRELAGVEPDRYHPDLALSLSNLSVTLRSLGRLDEAVEARRESVAIWKACAERDPELHGPSFRRADAAFRKLLADTGYRDEAATFGLVDGGDSAEEG